MKKKNEHYDLTKENIVACRLTRVTFGFLLAATIHHLNHEQEKFLETVDKLRNSIYVDVMIRATHESQAKCLYQDAKKIFLQSRTEPKEMNIKQCRDEATFF